MPEIVFVCETTYCRDNDDEEAAYLMTLWDKNGSYYRTDYAPFCTLPSFLLFVRGSAQTLALLLMTVSLYGSPVTRPP